MKAARSALIQSLGGEAQVSTQQRLLAGMIARDSILLETFDAYLLGTRRRDFALLIGQRETLASALTRRLSLLGLDRHEESPLDALRRLQTNATPSPAPTAQDDEEMAEADRELDALLGISEDNHDTDNR